MKKNHKLSVFLLKSYLKDFTNALKEGFNDYEEHKIKTQANAEGLIIIGITRTNPPSWEQLLQEGSQTKITSLKNASNRAVLFFKVKGRVFAIAFGYGKHIIKEELIERDFGLRTALNLLDSEKFISIDKANLSDMALLTKMQSSRKSRPEAFNLDVISDLLRGVTAGISKSSNDLGSIITGNEGVYLSPKINFFDIPDKLKKLIKAYESEKYKENFDWIDNLKEEKNPKLIDQLRDLLIEALKNEDTTNIHLASPNIINWENYEGYAYSSVNDDLKMDLDISDFYLYKADKLQDLNWDVIKRLSIYLKYVNNEIRASAPFWRFINFEVEYKDAIYLFTLGKWYQINKNYVDDIRNYVKGIEESQLNYIPCAKDASEGEYNELLAASNKDYLLFDKNLVKSDYYNRSNIEVCDVLSISNKEFIHVKPRSSSSTLSHLFAQGRISSTAILRDDSFRKNFRARLGKMKATRDIVPLDRKQLKPSEYTITFALIDKKDRSFIDALPFFSLINFRLTLESLIEQGFKVKVKNILRNNT